MPLPLVILTTQIQTKNDLSKLINELGDLSEDKEVEESEDKDVYQNESERTTFKKHMILCWKIVSNMLKLQTLL